MTARAIDASGIASDPHYGERRQLAAAFRWAARHNWHEGVANHFSLMVPGAGTRFLMNPRGRHFSRMRASDLLLLDADDEETLSGPNAPDATAWHLHGALHRLAPHATCALHLHPKYVLALAALKDSSMPPICQNSMRFFERIAVDDGFAGMALGDEGARACGKLGNKPVLLMGNHGVMITAPTVAQAFDDLYFFERACETLITALSTGRELRIASDEVARRTCQQWIDYPDLAEDHFTALLEILDEEEPDYRH